VRDFAEAVERLSATVVEEAPATARTVGHH
jgi:hypothetical protein